MATNVTPHHEQEGNEVTCKPCTVQRNEAKKATGHQNGIGNAVNRWPLEQSDVSLVWTHLSASWPWAFPRLVLLAGVLVAFLLRVAFLVLGRALSTFLPLSAFFSTRGRRSWPWFVFFPLLLVTGRLFPAFALFFWRSCGDTWRRRSGPCSGGSLLREVELCERRHEFPVAFLFGTGTAHVENNVLVWVYLEKVAALVGEVARVAALLARWAYGVRRLVGESSYNFAQVVLHGACFVTRTVAFSARKIAAGGLMMIDIVLFNKSTPPMWIHYGKNVSGIRLSYWLDWIWLKQARWLEVVVTSVRNGFG